MLTIDDVKRMQDADEEDPYLIPLWGPLPYRKPETRKRGPRNGPKSPGDMIAKGGIWVKKRNPPQETTPQEPSTPQGHWSDHI
jgi:hypothetical protein